VNKASTRRFEAAVALVTGGGSGLGEAVSVALAGEGATVVVADIDGAAAARVAEQANANRNGGRAVPLRADVTHASEVRDMVARACEAGAGRLSAMVLSAAIELRGGVVDCTDEDWQRIIDTNLKGAFLCLRAALPVMAAGGGGAVVALGSTLGLMAAPGYPAYCASKAGLLNLCKQAAIEHAADGVRVNVVAPSATDTGLAWRTTERAEDPVRLRETLARHVPMGRLGRASDVTATVLFLLSEEAAYISGCVVPVDGGMAARRSI